MNILSLEKEEEQKLSSPKENLSVEYEIECPRCHDVMTLQSDFDRFCYFCEECCFTLSLKHF
jgi:hypothetical protein